LNPEPTRPSKEVRWATDTTDLSGSPRIRKGIGCQRASRSAAAGPDLEASANSPPTPGPVEPTRTYFGNLWRVVPNSQRELRRKLEIAPDKGFLRDFTRQDFSVCANPLQFGYTG